MHPSFRFSPFGHSIPINSAIGHIGDGGKIESSTHRLVESSFYSPCWLDPVSEPTTFLDSSTRNRLFVLSANSKETSVPLHVKQDDDIGRYIGLNKRAYGQAIACSCVLQNYEFATVLYDILVLNRIRPRKNTYFAILDVCVHVFVNYRELEGVTGMLSIILC